ncbi:MAG TPA: efflux RND transporter periplasmic adaptor subunit [Candidatus Cybelea sp.]|jgi:multidrug efflux pump subunit AcrA (membrane-fusion protein)|nr:efflux RND transporter periplasmic adaptor subunit [Candidatus Cybelea sp.]
MDVIRERSRRLPKWPYAVALGAGALLAIVFATRGMNSRGNVTVERATLVTDVARAGTLVRSVSAQGAFVPDRVRVVAATQSGVIDQIFVKPGSVVVPGTVVAKMENPSLDAAARDAQAQLAVARADLESAQQQARTEQLTQEGVLDGAQAQMEQSALQAQSLATLHRRGLVADVQYRQAIIASRKDGNDVRIAGAQLGAASADARAKVSAAQARVVQAQAQLDAGRAQVDALTVRSATSGIVQSVELDPGTSAAQNSVIAHVADTSSLKAVLQVAEGDVHAVAPGMRASIDTGNGVLQGRVSRVAPAAGNGTVATDVTFSRPLPRGVRADTNVDGVIYIATIRDALAIARPAGATDGSVTELFKVVDGGKAALRVRVHFGRGSADRISVLSGLEPGDTVIVSDMSNDIDQTMLNLR